MGHDIATGRHKVSLSVPKGEGIAPEQHFAKENEVVDEEPRYATREEIMSVFSALQKVREKHAEFAITRLSQAVGMPTQFCGELKKRTYVAHETLEQLAKLLGLTLRELMAFSERHEEFHKKVNRAIIKNDLRRRQPWGADAQR